MNKTRELLSELKDIISDYDYLLDKSVGCGIYSISDYEEMENMKNRAYEIIDNLSK